MHFEKELNDVPCMQISVALPIGATLYIIHPQLHRQHDIILLFNIIHVLHGNEIARKRKISYTYLYHMPALPILNNRSVSEESSQ